MPRPAYKTLGEAIASVMDHAGITTVALAERLRERDWKVDQSRVSKWRNGHERPHDLDLFPDIEAICGAPRGTILRLAGYVADDIDFKVNEDDPEEVAIWNLTKLPRSYRIRTIEDLREANAGPPPSDGKRRRSRKSA